ncbi:hypothetical protein ACFE04_025145 [Oxalis oulophora]
MARKNNGRQKIKMQKMQNESNLQVTFSKRKYGLFKKASELSTLCGVKIAIIVFSPGKKVFSFGHPSVESVIDRFLPEDQNVPTLNLFGSAHMQHVDVNRNPIIHALNMQLTQVQDELDAERKIGVELTRMRKDREAQIWWKGPIEQLNFSQLKQLKAVVEELKKNVIRQVDGVIIESANPPPPPPQFFPIENNTPRTQHDFNSNDNKNNIVFDPNSMPYGFNLGYGHGGFF